MALLAYLKEQKNNAGPHLIIVPNAVMVNWKAELIQWLPAMRCVYYVGNKDERSQIFISQVFPITFNILVTTYEFIMRDRAKLASVRTPAPLCSTRSCSVTAMLPVPVRVRLQLQSKWKCAASALISPYNFNHKGAYETAQAVLLCQLCHLQSQTSNMRSSDHEEQGLLPAASQHMHTTHKRQASAT